jgi:hypothetical protein
MVVRREFLRKAAVAGTGAFVVPTIVTVDPANAQALTSPPPEPPGSSNGPPDLVDSPGSPAPSTPIPSQGSGGRTELPRTGADLDRLAVAGLAATAGGAALVLWSAKAGSASTPAPESIDAQPES